MIEYKTFEELIDDGFTPSFMFENLEVQMLEKNVEGNIILYSLVNDHKYVLYFPVKDFEEI